LDGRATSFPAVLEEKPKAVPGSGLGHPDVTVGTFGCLVRKAGDEGLFILSNSHVLANEGLARIGDPIVQPGAHDDRPDVGDRPRRQLPDGDSVPSSDAATPAGAGRIPRPGAVQPLY
jgi:hypothetical protein